MSPCETEGGSGFAFASAPFPSCEGRGFGTARSRQGRAVCARRSEPLTARTVPEGCAGGKGGRGSQGVSPLAGVRGSAPRTLPRVLLARGIKQLPLALMSTAIPNGLTLVCPPQTWRATDDWLRAWPPADFFAAA